jgi:hypothetical protein
VPTSLWEKNLVVKEYNNLYLGLVAPSSGLYSLILLNRSEKKKEKSKKINLKGIRVKIMVRDG